MRHNVVRVHAVIQEACCTASTSPSHRHDDAHAQVEASVGRWWHCLHVVAKLVGNRQLMCLLREAGALWALGEDVVTPTPCVRPHVVTAATGEPDGKRGRGGRGGGGGHRASNSSDPKLSSESSTEAALHEEPDAVAALDELRRFQQAVTRMQSAAAQRDYVMSCLLKVAAFCERCTGDLQEHASATQPDKLTATLSSTQGLEATTLQEAPIRGIEATADRMFPFRGGRDVLYETLRHASMLQALVLCALEDDQTAHRSVSSGAVGGAVLGAPPPFFLHDFLVLRSGCRIELLSADRPADNPPPHAGGGGEAARGHANWRVPVASTSVRTVGDGVAMVHGALGVMATMEDEASHRPRFVPIYKQQLKFLTYAMAPSRGPAPPPPPQPPHTRPEKQRTTAVATRGGRQGAPAAAAAVAKSSAPKPPPVWIVEDVVQDDTDLLGPMRRSTRRVARILNGGSRGLASVGDGVDATDEVVIDVERQRSMTQSDGGAGAAPAAPPRYGAGSDRCNSREQLVATLQLLMCFAVRLTTLGETPPPPPTKGTQQDHLAAADALRTTQHDDQSIPFGFRLVLTSLLVLHSMTADAVHATRMASPEMAWFVVERVVNRAATAPPTIGRVMAAGYALCLVEPAAMALPLWYGLLTLIHRNDTSASMDGSHTARRIGFSVYLWGLFEQCTFRHPLLPSVMPSGIWEMMEAHSLGLRRGPHDSGSGGRTGTSPVQRAADRSHSGKVLMLSRKSDAASMQRSTSPLAAPMSPTLSDASVVEIDARGFPAPAAGAGARGRRRAAGAPPASGALLVFEDVEAGWMTSRRKRTRGTPSTDDVTKASSEPPTAGGPARRLEDTFPAQQHDREEVICNDDREIATDAKYRHHDDPPVRDDWMMRCHCLLSSLLDAALDGVGDT